MGGDVYAQLEAEYCPPIDSALFFAIVSDFDTSNAASLEEAKTTLDALKASALEEESSGFDPSGSGGYEDLTDGRDASTSQTGTNTSPYNDPDTAGISNGLSSLGLTDGASENGSLPSTDDVDLDSLDVDTKILLLKDVFPSMSDYTISHSLKKCDSNWQRALDDLLNQSYLADTNSADHGISTKGIDAFSEDNISRRGRKGKKKGKNQKNDQQSGVLQMLDTDNLPQSNKWQSASQDVDFIVLHSNLDASMVRSAYYSNNASIPQTISYFLKDTMKSDTKITADDPVVKAHAVDLGKAFPNIAPSYLTAIIRLTHPSTTSAHELAKALIVKRPASTSSTPITPQYATPNLSDDEYEAVGKKRPKSVSSSHSTDFDHIAASSLAVTHSTAYRAASAQAQAAYRKSRSNHLMSGAAGYYAQVGREHAAASQRYTSAAANALVDSQSSADQIDLHGVNVQDAVRISKKRVESWWNNMGENRVNGRVGAADRARGFNIVTGVGHHSEGGKGKLGPAVSRMLVAEGWRIESGSGVIVVRGRSRTG